MGTLNETVPVEPEQPDDEWVEIDKLRGKLWAVAVLKRRKELFDKLVDSRAEAAIVRRYVARDTANLKAFEEKLRPRMKNRRPRLLRRFRGLIKTDDGEIRIFSRNKVLDLDDVTDEELVEALDVTRMGRTAVRIKKEPDKEVLKHLSPRFLRTLAPIKVWVGQMRYVSIKTVGEKDAVNLVRERRKK